MPAYTKLHGINNTTENHVIELLHENVKEFFNWGLLEAGYFSDSTINAVGVSDNSPSTLKSVVDSTRPNGTVWQAKYRQWVYESGLESGREPIEVPGVYINGVLRTTGYKIDYLNGTLYLTTPVPTTAVVQVSYSYKNIGIYDDNVSWFRDIILDSYDYLKDNKITEALNKDAVQTPFILIESNPFRNFKPREFGNFSQVVDQDFLVHVVAENKKDRNNMVDIITNQIDHPIRLFDINKRNRDGLFNTVNGVPTNTGLFYPDLVADNSPYLLRLAQFVKMTPQSVSPYLPLFRAVIKVTVRVDNF